jgi:predicted nucleotidyltransferase
MEARHMKTLSQWKPGSPHEREVVLAAKKTIVSLFPGSQVILYGSRAREQAQSDSDYDLLVVTPEKTSWLERGRLNHELVKLELEKNCLVSTIVEDRDTWDTPLRRGAPIRERIERDGVVL